jgi:hypothetical protein
MKTYKVINAPNHTSNPPLQKCMCAPFFAGKNGIPHEGNQEKGTPSWPLYLYMCVCVNVL